MACRPTVTSSILCLIVPMSTKCMPIYAHLFDAPYLLATNGLATQRKDVIRAACTNHRLLFRITNQDLKSGHTLYIYRKYGAF